MTQFLVDTNVMSELGRPAPSAAFMSAMRLIPLEALFLSDVVLAEIRYGIENTASRTRRESLLAWVRDGVRPSFAGRILPISEAILLRWRWIIEGGRQRGYTFEQSDALLAATAHHHDLTVLSRDSRPFHEADVPCIDPWSGPGSFQ